MYFIVEILLVFFVKSKSKMPKIKKIRIVTYILMFQSSEDFLINISVLFSNFCEVKIRANKRFTVLQHLRTEKYIRSINHIDKPKKNSTVS